MMNRTLSIVTIGVVSAFFCRQASAQWAQPSGAQVYNEGASCDMPGADYKQVSASNDTDCGNTCLADSYCRSWAFNVSNHTCYLKNGAPAEVAAGSNRICGFIAPRWEWDIDRVGNDIASLFTFTVESCELACGSNPNCTQWTFNEARMKEKITPDCYLKSGWSAPQERDQQHIDHFYQCGTPGQPQTCVWSTYGHLVSGVTPN
jgi:hypothetical protein